MTKKFLLMALVLGFALALCGIAYAQTDDDAVDDDAVDDDASADDDATTFDSSSFAFTLPTAIAANTQYTFTFDVFNAAQPSTKATKGIWIREVDLNLPANYVLAAEADQLAAPSCLHTGDGYCDHWEANFDSTANKITWQSFGTITTVEFGDIREQDTQTFSFLATTDDGPANAFPWKLWGDDGDPIHGGNGSFVEGTAVIGGADDDTITDDDTTSGDNGGGDNGGCGC